MVPEEALPPPSAPPVRPAPCGDDEAATKGAVDVEAVVDVVATGAMTAPFDTVTLLDEGFDGCWPDEEEEWDEVVAVAAL